MKYDDRMDKACLPICDAINSIPGLRTVESCCGHGKHGMWIWLKADQLDGLWVIARSLNKWYGGPVNKKYEEWKCIVTHNDMSTMPRFLIESSTKGKVAYKQAKQIAENIKAHKKWQRKIRKVDGTI